MALSPEQIQELLGPQPSLGPSNAPEQTSQFVRWFDQEMRCANRGCSSPTYIKVKGVPRCTMHTIHELDRLLNESLDEASESNSIESLAFGEL